MENRQAENRPDNASPGSEKQDDQSLCCAGKLFEIHVKGHLNSKWSDWLEGMQVQLLENGEMILFGTIVDQAALMGVLNKLCRLNLTLLSVNEMKTKEGDKNNECNTNTKP